MSNTKPTTNAILAEVAEERFRQDLNFPGDLVAGHVNGTEGVSEIPAQRELSAAAEREAREECEAFKDTFGVGSFNLILREEIAEANAAETPAELRKELIQVAAVAVKWVEYLDAVEAKGTGQSIADAIEAIAPVGDLNL